MEALRRVKWGWRIFPVSCDRAAQSFGTTGYPRSDGESNPLCGFFNLVLGCRYREEALIACRMLDADTFLEATIRDISKKKFLGSEGGGKPPPSDYLLH
jgi:hypothetical protein